MFPVDSDIPGCRLLIAMNRLYGRWVEPARPLRAITGGLTPPEGSDMTPQSRAHAESDADDATVIQPSRRRLEVLVAGDLTAVDVQDLAGDVGRGLQEQDAVHHVADLAGPPERGTLGAEVL